MSPVLVPQSEFKDIVERIYSLGVSGQKLGDFEYRLLKRKAESLLDSEASHGYSALGVIESFVGNYNEAKQFHLKALRLQPNSSTLNHNYAVTLHGQGDFLRAKDYLSKSMEMANDGGAPVNTDPLHASVYWHLGEMNGFLDFLDKINISEEDDREQLLVKKEEALKMSRAMEDCGISDIDIRTIKSVMASIRLKNNVHHISSDFFAHKDEEDGLVISVVDRVDLSPQEAAKLNWDLSEALAESDLVATSFVSGAYLPAAL